MANIEAALIGVPHYKCVMRQLGLLRQYYGIKDFVNIRVPAIRLFSSEADPFDVVLEGTISRKIPKGIEEERALKQLKGPTPSDPRILSATIIGMPNAGKSTLTNALLGWRVASVSKKVHTTLRNTKAVIVEGNSQIVLLDTPGIVSRHEMRKHNLEQAMLTEPKESISDVDLIIALVDVSNVWHRRRLDGKLLELLKRHAEKPSILVLNKVDLLRSKRVLLDTTRRLTEGFIGHVPIRSTKVIKPKPPINEMKHILTRAAANEDKSDESDTTSKSGENYDSARSDGWPHFEHVFMISALEKDGVEDLKDYLISQTSSGDWRCSPHVVTDEKPQEIIKLAVREKLLDSLPEEVPYNLNLKIESLEVDQYSTMRIVVSIAVPKERQMKLVIGGEGCIVRKVADGARQELMNTFRCDVLLKLIVECSQKRATRGRRMAVYKHTKLHKTKLIKAD